MDFQTFAVYNLLGVASESRPTILGINVKLLCVRPKVVDEGSQDICTDTPSVLSTVVIKQGVLDFGSFIC